MLPKSSMDLNGFILKFIYWLTMFRQMSCMFFAITSLSYKDLNFFRPPLFFFFFFFFKRAAPNFLVVPDVYQCQKKYFICSYILLKWNIELIDSCSCLEFSFVIWEVLLFEVCVVGLDYFLSLHWQNWKKKRKQNIAPFLFLSLLKSLKEMQ